ncbi:unnamed protein product [Allacma fusca]|uniref:Peptidase S1 domain-containing protein n=1 Tax=Allacma fusca TaxID=39272 RepID=A0A8J2JZ51_9HEXA|nr:unnamed protein product [Allacma fusca]
MAARLALLTPINSKKCQNTSSTHSKLVRPNTFCAAIKKGSEACAHYAGAGFVSISSNHTRLTGIRTGLPFNCNEPIVFTRLSKFTDWILKEVHGIVKPVTTTTTSTSTTTTTTTTPRPTTKRTTAVTGQPPTTRTPFDSPRIDVTGKPPTTSTPFDSPRTTSRTNPLSIQTRRPETNSDPRKTSRPPRPMTTSTKFPFVEDDDEIHIASWEQGVRLNHSNSNQHHPAQYPNYLAVQTTKPPKSTSRPRQPEKPQREPELPFLVDEALDYRHKRCPALESSEGGFIKCRHSRGRDDDCANGGWAGTLATYQCRKHYSPVFGFDTIQRNCSDQGHWRPVAEFGCKLDCGISSLPKNAFIVNGALSDRVSWPWHATIFTNTSDQVWSYRCGGALISKNVILTAAHCVTYLATTTKIPKEELVVFLAARSSDLGQNLDDPHAKIFSVEKISIPETYNAVTFNSDIALIQLSDDVELSDYIKPVCWPSRRNADHRTLERIHLEYSSTIKGFAVGFGVDEKGEIGQVLKETALPYVTAQACRDALDRTPTDSQFCAGYLNGTAVCNGDSGGGLYFSDTTQSSTRFIIQGIISNGDSYKGNKDSGRGSKFCNYNNYAVFTRVINFSEWIHNFMDSILDKRRSSNEMN